MHTTASTLAWNHVQLDAAQKTLRATTTRSSGGLIEAYEYGDLGYLAVLMQAKSFGDFVERWNESRSSSRRTKRRSARAGADAQHVEAIQTGLLADEASLHNAQAAAGQQQVALAALAQQRQNLLAVAQTEKQDVEVQVGELEDTSAEAEAALEALVREKQQEEDPAGPPNAGPHSSPASVAARARRARPADVARVGPDHLALRDAHASRLRTPDSARRHRHRRRARAPRSPPPPTGG